MYEFDYIHSTCSPTAGKDNCQTTSDTFIKSVDLKFTFKKYTLNKSKLNVFCRIVVTQISEMNIVKVNTSGWKESLVESATGALLL